MTYAEASRQLGKKDRVKHERNTWLERKDDKTIVVIYHETAIVTFTRQFIELDSGGWHTRSTVDRMRSNIPGDLGSKGVTGWLWYPLAELPCYCVADAERSHEGITLLNDLVPGMRLHYTGERDAGDKPIYNVRECENCHGTAKVIRSDFDNGHPYFDGMRVHPSGTRLMAAQPRRPRSFEPVKTTSGWS
jgi:hypothetical protein